MMSRKIVMAAGGLLSLLLLNPYPVRAAVPKEAAVFNGHSYYLYNIGGTYENAMKYCNSRGGYLATISSKEENDFLYYYILSMGTENAYFGYTDSGTEGSWRWVGKESSSYTNWAEGEPNSQDERENYAMFYWGFSDGTWNDGVFGDGSISDDSYFLCEWDTAPAENAAGKYSIPKKAAAYKNNLYYVFKDGGTWEIAKYKCEQMGGHLVTFSSAKENKFVFDLVQAAGHNCAWIGLKNYGSSVKPSWKWITGEKMSYINWMEMEPDYDFNGTEMYGGFWGNSGWNDYRSYDAEVDGYYVCEWEGKAQKQIDISKTKISLDKTTYTYDGKAKKPKITVKYKNKKLKSSAYKVKYTDNVYPGTAKVIITGKGTYTGSVRKKYTIKAGNAVKITLDGNGGKISGKKSKTIKVKYGSVFGSLPTAKNSGYNFEGWYTKKSGGKNITEKSRLESKKAQTLYARWKAKKYKITYQLGGGKNSSKNPDTYKVTTKTFSFAEPSRKGYTFKGWYTDKKYKKAIKKVKKGTTGDLTVYAKWKKEEQEISLGKEITTDKKVKIAYYDEGKRSYSCVYNDAYFTKNAADDNRSLALLSALAAGSTYTPKDGSGNNASIMMEKCGFIADGGFIFSDTGSKLGHSKDGDYDHARIQLGYKTISKGKTRYLLTAIFINGYSYGGYEWISNFNVGTGKKHKGFYNAAKEVLTIVKKHVDSYQKKAGKTLPVKYWICGHSRGGAVTNIVAESLSKEAGGENVFAYGFATPRYSQNTASLANIKNYINVADIVPLVAPSAWGFNRNNYKSGKSEKPFKATAKLQANFLVLTKDTFTGASEKQTIKLLGRLLEIAPTLEAYNKKNHTKIVGVEYDYTIKDIIQWTVAKAMTGEKKPNPLIEAMKIYKPQLNVILQLTGSVGNELVEYMISDNHRISTYILGTALM